MDDPKATAQGKEIIEPALQLPRGVYRCPFCGRMAERAGRCPDDGIPLRRLSRSRT